jgi:flagellar FliJ protein
VGFRYRYEPLLSYKGHLKEKAEIDLSLAQRRLRKCREILEEYHHGLEQTHEAFAYRMKKRLSSGELKNFSGYILALEMKIANQEIEIAKAEKVVREKLGVLLEKTKQFKVFERLKERDYQKWIQQQNIAEQKEKTEVTLMRYGKEFL